MVSVRCAFPGFVGSSVSPGVTGGSLPSGSLPFAVASLITQPATISFSVTVYDVSNAFVSPGFRESMVQLPPVSSSVTFTSVSV